MKLNNLNLNVQMIIITEDEAGQRIDNFLRTKLKGVPKNIIFRIMRKGEVRVNKKRVKPTYKLQHNDAVRIPPLRQDDTKKNTVFLKKLDTAAVLYEDEHMLVLNKPAAMAVHGGSGLSFGLIEMLRALRPNNCFLELVHRLDRETSGALLIAKKRSALRDLHQQLREKKMQKDYLALVHGHWKSYVKVVSVPLLKKTTAAGKRIVTTGYEGKPSETHFSVEERFTMATLVRASTLTGRTHQIRVHTQYAGHPIAFDNRYGDGTCDRQLKNCGMHRLFLHATTICFAHPASGEKLQIEAPFDASLRCCLNYMREYHK